MQQPNRNRQGKYARKWKFKAFVLLLIIGGIAYAVLNAGTTTVYNSHTATSTPETADQSAIDKIKQRADFKARMENQAKQVYLQEQIDQKEKAIAELKGQEATLETQLEQTRNEGLGF